MPIDVTRIIEGFAERRDDQAIVALAERLAVGKKRDDASSMAEAAVERLSDRDPKVQSGCIKILYEMGYRRPEVIARYAETFIRLLKNRNNRLVWGGMIALSTVAPLEPGLLYERRAEILEAICEGSVISQDRGLMALGLVAAADPGYRKELFPTLLGFLRGCRASDVAKFGEYIIAAVDGKNSAEYRQALESRLGELNPSSRKRAEKLLRDIPATSG
jgi:hypothetical protein